MMNNWNGHDMSGWSYGLMSFVMLVFTALVIFGAVLLVRNLSGDDHRVVATTPNNPAQDQPDHGDSGSGS